MRKAPVLVTVRMPRKRALPEDHENTEDLLVRTAAEPLNHRDEVLRRVDRYLKDEAYLLNFGLRARDDRVGSLLTSMDRRPGRFAISINLKRLTQSGFLSPEVPSEDYEAIAGLLSAGLLRSAYVLLNELEGVRKLPLDSSLFPEDPMSASITARSVFTCYLRKNGEFQTHPWETQE